MLLRQTGEGVFAITQPAHAWLSGIMAGVWGNDRFAAPEPRGEIRLAAGLHDIGWLDWEREPSFDPRTGWPRVFADVPAEEHTKLWRRGVEHAATYSRYAATLVSMHGDTIYDKTFDPATARPEAAEAVRRFRAEGAAFQQRSAASLRGDRVLAAQATDARLALAKRLLAALDTLSLQICWGAVETVVADVPVSEHEAASLTLRATGDRVCIDPWPFAPSALTLHLQGRRLPHPFADEGAMRVGLAAAEATTLAITLHPR